MEEIIKIFADDILDDISSEITLDNRIKSVKYSYKTAARKHMTIAEISFEGIGENGEIPKDCVSSNGSKALVLNGFKIGIDKPWFTDYAFTAGDVIAEKTRVDRNPDGGEVKVKSNFSLMSPNEWTEGDDRIAIKAIGADSITVDLRIVIENNGMRFKRVDIKLSGEALEVKSKEISLGEGAVDDEYEMPCNLLKSGAAYDGVDLCAADAEALANNNRYGKQTVNLQVPVVITREASEANKTDFSRLNIGALVQVFKCRACEYDSSNKEAQTIALDRFGRVKSFIVTKVESVYDGEYIKNLELKEVYQ